MSNQDLLQKLFKWKKHIQYEGIDFYIRIVGDQVIEDIRQAALLESRKTRRLLRDKNSNEYLIHLDPMHDFDDEELRAALVILAARDVYRDYTASTPKQIIPPLKDHPSLEEQEEYQRALEERDTQYIQDVQQYVEGWRTKYLANLENAPRHVLEQQYSRYRAERVCEDVFNSVFEDQLIASSIFNDPDYTQRTFSYAEYKELPREVKGVFVDAYTSISLETDDLKK